MMRLQKTRTLAKTARVRHPRKAALKQAARERGLGKREAYKQLLLER